MNFSETLKNLESKKDSSLAQECLNIMLNDHIIFNPGIEQEREKLTSLYSLRLDIAKDLNKEKYTNEEIQNWELVINELKNSKAKKLKLNWVGSESKSYFMFWNSESKQLAGILCFNSKSTIKQQEEYNTNTIEKGLSVSSQKYSQGEFIKDWK